MPPQVYIVHKFISNSSLLQLPVIMKVTGDNVESNARLLHSEGAKPYL